MGHAQADGGGAEGWAMKRSLYDAEYDKVRREADVKLTPNQRANKWPGFDQSPEFPEPGKPPVDLARVDRAHADFKARMSALEASHAKAAAEASARSTTHTLASNKLVMVREYQQCGVSPPFVDDKGLPRYSLAFLLKMGWTIEELGGGERILRKGSRP